MNYQTASYVKEILSKLKESLNRLNSTKYKLCEKLKTYRVTRAQELDAYAFDMFPKFSIEIYAKLKDDCPKLFTGDVEDIFEHVFAEPIPFFTKLFKNQEKYIAEKFTVEANLIRAKIKQLEYNTPKLDVINKAISQYEADLTILTEKERNLLIKIECFSNIDKNGQSINLSPVARQNIQQAHAKLHKNTHKSLYGYRDQDESNDLLFFTTNLWLNNLNNTWVINDFKSESSSEFNYKGGGQSAGAGASGDWSPVAGIDHGVIQKTASDYIQPITASDYIQPIAVDDSLGRFS
jgi:hypothetical protein